MHIFKKRKVNKDGKIIVDHGNNDIRIYRTPGDLVNMNIERVQEDRKQPDHRDK